MQVKHEISFCALLMLGAGALMFGSCGEKAIAPVPENYRLYVGVHGGPPNYNEGWVAVIDCVTDRIVDSLGYPGMHTTVFPFISRTGKYLATAESGRYTRIWGLPERQIIATITPPQFVHFLPGDTLAMTWTAPDTSRVYEVPAFDTPTELQVGMYEPEAITGSELVTAIDLRGSPVTVQDHSLVVIMNIVSRQIADSFLVFPYSVDDPFEIFSFDISSDTERFYAVGYTESGGAELLCYDVATRSVRFRHSLTVANGTCRLTPDEDEVWVTDPGTAHPALPAWPGVIVVYDAAAGGLIDTIHTYGFYPEDSTRRLSPQDIRFVPNLPKAYINCGSFTRGRQPILVIDTESLAIVSRIFGEFNRLPEFIDLGPAP